MPSIDSHINRKYGCPCCSERLPWNLERVLLRGHDIHKGKYNYSDITEEHILGVKSHIPVKCNKCKNIWYPTIGNHINNETNCPCYGHGFSKIGLDWLKLIEINENIFIQSASSIEGEYKIKNPKGTYYRVDGYCITNNTIYEYYGDYWHGNPNIYDKNQVNPTNKKTYGELYEKTIYRENYIKSLGYNLITKWETSI
jgi:hypothetical protein